MRLWADGSQSVNLVIAHPTGLAVEEPRYLISNDGPLLDLVWAYCQRFRCEQQFHDQKSGIFKLTAAGCGIMTQLIGCCWSSPALCWQGSLQAYGLSLAGLRPQVDPHWQVGSFLRIGMAALQMIADDATARLMA